MTAPSEAMRIRYSREGAAEQLSISKSQVDRLRAAGKLVGRVDGGRVFFDRDELVSYAKSCPCEGDVA